MWTFPFFVSVICAEDSSLHLLQTKAMDGTEHSEEMEALSRRSDQGHDMEGVDARLKTLSDEERAHLEELYGQLTMPEREALLLQSGSDDLDGAISGKGPAPAPPKANVVKMPEKDSELCFKSSGGITGTFTHRGSYNKKPLFCKDDGTMVIRYGSTGASWDWCKACGCVVKGVCSGNQNRQGSSGHSKTLNLPITGDVFRWNSKKATLSTCPVPEMPGKGKPEHCFVAGGAIKGTFRHRGTHNKKPLLCRDDGTMVIRYGSTDKGWDWCDARGCQVNHRCTGKWNRYGYSGNSRDLPKTGNVYRWGSSKVTLSKCPPPPAKPTPEPYVQPSYGAPECSGAGYKPYGPSYRR